MHSTAIILNGARDLSIAPVTLTAPQPSDLVVKVHHSGVSTGTEKLLWSGDMPSFPGMGYPLVPGYEAVGEVVEAGSETEFNTGDMVFVPGATCYEDARGLFGAASELIVTDASRATKLDKTCPPEMTLLALTATAYHALAGAAENAPELIVGHGVVGCLLARLTIAAGGAAPTVWDNNPMRHDRNENYEVVFPEDDPRRDYKSIYDASGDSSILNNLIARLSHGGEIVLAGFYAEPLSFDFPPAFMKEARVRVAAEWTPEDMQASRALVENGMLSMAGLISHRAPASSAKTAYATAFEDPNCLKMVLDWEEL